MGVTEGSLAGWRGTTPAPETTPEVEAFQAKMDEADPDLKDYNYGPESYDAVMIIALAVEIAEDRRHRPRRRDRQRVGRR